MYSTSLCYLERDGKWLMLHRVTKKNDYQTRASMSVSAASSWRERARRSARRARSLRRRAIPSRATAMRVVVTFVFRSLRGGTHAPLSVGRIHRGVSRHGGGNFFLGPEGRSFKAAALGGGPHFSAAVTANIPFFSLKLCYEGDALVSAKLNGTPLPL